MCWVHWWRWKFQEKNLDNKLSYKHLCTLGYSVTSFAENGHFIYSPDWLGTSQTYKNCIISSCRETSSSFFLWQKLKITFFSFLAIYCKLNFYCKWLVFSYSGSRFVLNMIVLVQMAYGGFVKRDGALSKGNLPVQSKLGLTVCM